MKRNVTVVIDDETARWLRVEAAKRDTSVSGYLGEIVQRERDRTEGYADAMERFMARPARRLGEAGAALPSREEIHRR